MSAVGIVAEFNPLHKGHEYLITAAKKQGTVVSVLSGNFVQRGDTAIAEKRIRAESALNAGVDLVLELPVLWSMSTAQNFALGGISALKAAGCEKIIFGSECGNIEALQAAADILISTEFTEKLSHKLKDGITFAAARQAVAEELGVEKGILDGANNNLGIEYIIAAKSIGFNVRFETVQRKGAQHDSLDEAEFVSASLLRNKLLNKDYAFCEKYMSAEALSLFKEDSISDISRLDKAVLAVLRTRSEKDFARLPDLSEGVENKLQSALRIAKSVEELYNEVKVKRYTLARIRRLVLSAFIGLDNSFFMKPLPYVRVLGFSKSGQEQLKFMTKSSEIPVITRAAQIKNLGATEQKIFETECRATDLFMLSLKTPGETGLEYTSKLIKKENL